MTGRRWLIPVGILVIAVITFFVIRGVTPTDNDVEVDVVVTDDEWSDTFKDSCLSCHGIDDGGHVERISDIRKTPEGWEATISRMQTAWGLDINDEDKNAIVKELSDKNGLAPEETEEVMYWLTNTGSDFEPIEQEEYDRMQNACLSCHAGGRPLAQYRTEEEWMKLKDFHIGFNPSSVYQMRGVNFEEEAEEILAFLATIQPKESAEWEEWKNKDIDYDFEGEWRIVGYRPGFGLYSGHSTIETKDDHYFENRELLHDDGTKEKLEGNVRSYSGYSLRSSLQSGEDKIKGVFNLVEGEDIIKGRWNYVKDKGKYADEVYYRVDNTDLLDTWPKTLRANTTETVRVIGSKLNDNLTADDFTASDGLTIDSVEKQIGDDVWLNVTTDDLKDHYTIALADGGTELSLSGYEQIDYIKVKPEQGYARLDYLDNKQSVQLEAIAFSNGEDGEQGTDDDIEVGMVKVDWELLEYHEDGDDVAYVGEVDENGLFTPAEGGPNDERPLGTNNLGTVKAKATFTDPHTDTELTDESIVVITLPDYIPYIN